jgi:hypothetical protein
MGVGLLFSRQNFTDILDFDYRNSLYFPEFLFYLGSLL